VAVWAGAIATFFAVLVAILTSLGTFGRVRGPRLNVTFEHTEPRCRTVERHDGDAFWVRVGVENLGRSTAVAIGRLGGAVVRYAVCALASASGCASDHCARDVRSFGGTATRRPSARTAAGRGW
jgi:hypothetical protein